MDQVGGMEMVNSHLNVRTDFLGKRLDDKKAEDRDIECVVIGEEKKTEENQSGTIIGDGLAEAETPKLVNIHEIKGGEGMNNDQKRKLFLESAANNVYIGRPSVWGNPFRVGLNDSKDSVVEKYRQYLNNRPDLRAKTG